MSLIAPLIDAAERLPLPDPLTRAGIEFLVSRTRRHLGEATPDDDRSFAGAMADHAVAEHTDAANRQHYELPPEFFGLVLGPRRKYSCCLYGNGAETLAAAETAALDETIAHADLADGQHILELGCGWGSLTLAMAERFPRSRIVAVSNSRPQRTHILAEAATRGLVNVEVVTADMNDFDTAATFDRVVSVEMFEHMSNWPPLLQRIRRWLRPHGELFVHIFTHRAAPYRFDAETDWIGRHFFTGGIMPSRTLLGTFGAIFTPVQTWQWSGRHYERTALDWLARFDAERVRIDPILVSVYGRDAGLWARRWRLFFLATAGLFGHRGGSEWGVSHYRLKPVRG